MPGTIVRTATRTGPASGLDVGAGRFFIAGMAERGPTDEPRRALSLAEWEGFYGKVTTYSQLHAAVRVHFEEGGSEVWTARRVGTAATKGTLSLLDDSLAPGLATIAIDAQNAGPWSTRVTVDVVAGTIPGSRQLRVFLDGERQRSYDNLTTREQFVAATSTDDLIRARLVANATAAPANLPRILAATALSAGVDDRASVTAAGVVSALDLFDVGIGPGIVAVPGYPASDVRAGLLAHCKATTRLGVLALAETATYADALAAGPANQSADGEFLGLAYPWVRIPSATTGTQDVSPEGYFAAMRARAHGTTQGPTRAAFGDIAVARFALKPTVALTRAQGDALDEVGVSAIRTIANTTRLYGYRSLSTDTRNYPLLIGRDTLNVLAALGLERLEQYVGKSIDGQGQLYGKVAGTLKGMVAQFAESGGLYARIVDGRQLDPGYGVDVGPAVNTNAVRERGVVAAVLSVRVSPVGSLIDLTLVKAGLTAAV